jgi:hypothetical protein
MKTILLAVLALVLTGCVYGPHRPDYDDRYGRDHREAGEGQERVLVCHKGKKTMELPASALSGHLNHGDYRGPCR